jgi:hypothetical protein
MNIIWGNVRVAVMMDGKKIKGREWGRSGVLGGDGYWGLGKIGGVDFWGWEWETVDKM